MKYSKDFKEEALKLSDEVGVKKAAAQLGLPYYTLSDWRNKRKAEMKRPRLTETEAEKRICELEKENVELKTANEILKDIYLSSSGQIKLVSTIRKGVSVVTELNILDYLK